MEAAVGASCVAPTAAAEASWRARVPTLFTLAPEEVTTLKPPPPLFKNLPSQATLPMFHQDIIDHFLPFAPPLVDSSQLWFQACEQTLKWHIPIGILFDLLKNDLDQLPFVVTVHFTSFPNQTLLNCSTKAAEAVLLSALKESCHLMCGTTQPINSLSSQTQSDLFRAVANADHPAFDKVHTNLRRAMTAHLGMDTFEPRVLPVRVYAALDTWRQLPVARFRQDGQEVTLGDALCACLADSFAVDSHVACDAHAEDEEGSGEEGTREGDLRKQRHALVQGVSVPLRTKVSWLCEAYSHPDGFLYVSCPLVKVETRSV